MYPSHNARALAVLLRISRDLDIIGDVTATVDNPSELVAWLSLLDNPALVAWRAQDSAERYIQVTAAHDREPIRGRVTAVLHGGQHRGFWDCLLPDDLEPGMKQTLTHANLADAWNAMPITPPD